MSTTSPILMPRSMSLSSREGQAAGVDKLDLVDHPSDCPTPPQSASDRRPSTAQFSSSFSEARFSGAGSSTSPYTQPPTPVYNLSGRAGPQEEPYVQTWGDEVEVQPTMPETGHNSCSTGPQVVGNSQEDPFPQRPLYPFPFQQARREQLPLASEVPNVSSLPQFSDAPSMHSMDAFGISIPQVSQQDWHTVPVTTSVNFPLHPSTYRSSSLYTAGTGYWPDESPLPVLFPDHGPPLEGFGSCQEQVFYPVPQVVIPSHLSPHQTEYSLPTHNYDAFGAITTTGNSVGTGYPCAMYDDRRPASYPSPPSGSDFLDEGESDYKAIQRRLSISPFGVSSTQIHRVLGSNVGPSIEQRRRRTPAARRPRKVAAPGRAFMEYEWNNGLHVRLEGRPFLVERDASGRLSGILTDRGMPGSERDTKPHKCLHQDTPHSRPCGRSFERSEHLKRHMGMHSSERPYPCPLPGCDKRIGRPDNAGDHFKTHLRPPSKGKRNKHCDWPTLERCILAEYAEKPATKLLNNLRKWIAQENRAAEESDDVVAKLGRHI